MRIASETDLIEQIEAHLTQAIELADAVVKCPKALSRNELVDLTDILGASHGLLRHLWRTALGGEIADPPTDPPRPIAPRPAAAAALVTSRPVALPRPAAPVAPVAPPAVTSEVVSDAELIEQWRQHLAAASYARNTQRIRVSHMARLYARFPGLTSTTTRQLEQFMADFAKTNGPASLKTFQSSIRSFYGWAVEAELMAKDPTKALLRVRVPRIEGRTVTDQQVEAGLAIATPVERAMILLGREAGLRREEIASLKVADMEGTTLRVHGKGGKVRRIPVAERLRVALQAIQPETGDYYFPGAMYGHVHVDTVHDSIRRTVKVNPHALRHAAANSAYARTRDVQAVAAFLGHSSIATTQTYLHLHESQMQALAHAVALPAASGVARATN